MAGFLRHRWEQKKNYATSQEKYICHITCTSILLRFIASTCTWTTILVYNVHTKTSYTKHAVHYICIPYTHRWHAVCEVLVWRHHLRLGLQVDCVQWGEQGRTLWYRVHDPQCRPVTREFAQVGHTDTGLLSGGLASLLVSFIFRQHRCCIL